MRTILASTLFLFCLLFPLAANADPDNGSAQQEVLSRLIVNASKTPAGPVEDDLPSGVIKACTALLKLMKDPRHPHEALAQDYKNFTLLGPLTPLYANAKTALLSAPIKLSDAATHDPDLPLNADAGPGFGANVGGCMYLMAKLPADGRLIGTFCFVQENDAWKVHNYYVSASPLNDTQKKFITQQLDAYAN